jgi:hypothetical protein
MDRLTEKNDRPYSTDIYDIKINEYDYKNYSTGTSIGACLDKLGKLEDLEEQIGCPFDVIFKALQNGIWVKDKWQGIKHISPDELNISIRDDDVILQELYYEDLDSVMDTTGRRYYGSDYQKIWWLKENREE